MFAGLLRTKIINSDVGEVPLSYVIKNWLSLWFYP